MKLLLLGATGRTGKRMLKEALNQGYEINALVRDPGKIDSSLNGVRIFKGSPERIDDLAQAIKGCDGILSTLNISRISDFPWSKLRTPPTLLSDVMKNVISLTEKNGPSRIIVCSAWGVAETEADIPNWFRWLIKNSNIGVAYKDHERQENELKKSKLSWTIVRPSGLTNFRREKEIIVSYDNKPKPKLTLGRKNLAKFMVDALKREDLIGRTPVVSE